MRRRIYLFIEAFLRLTAAAGGLWMLLLLAVIAPWASSHMLRWSTFALVDASATLCLLVGTASVASRRRSLAIFTFYGAIALASIGFASMLTQGDHSSASLAFAITFFFLTVLVPLCVVALCVYDLRYLKALANLRSLESESPSNRIAGQKDAERTARRRTLLRTLIAGGFCLLVLSLLPVGALQISVKIPATDKFTLHMPPFWRKEVSDAVYEDDFHNDPASHMAMERVVRLYPANTDGWKRRCLWAGSSGDLQEDVRICEKATEAEPTFPLVVSALGRTQLASGDACAAQKTYEKAISLDDNVTHYADLESMALAALKCGDLPQAQAGLEAAIRIEESSRAGQRMYSGNDDDVARRDEEKDRRLLISIEEMKLVRK